jgi:hypothetical protein
MRLTPRFRVVTRVTHCLQIVPRQRKVGVVINANDVVDDGTGATAHDAHGIGSDKHTPQFAPRGRLVKR